MYWMYIISELNKFNLHIEIKHNLQFFDVEKAILNDI